LSLQIDDKFNADDGKHQPCDEIARELNRVKTLSSYFLALILITGCSGPRAYRYADRVLIPPGVRKAEISERSVTFSLTVKCHAESDAVLLRPVGRHVRVTVKPVMLRVEPAGWLENWALALEKRGCIPVGDSAVLAAQVAEIVPLEPRAALTLLHLPERDYVDLNAGSRLKAIGPLFREGAKRDTRTIESALLADGTLTVNGSPDLVGVETAWYSIEAYKNRPGAQILFLSAEDRVGDAVTHPDRPSPNYFHFAPDAAYYRLFTITRLSQSDHDMLVLAASTRQQLERQTEILEADPSQCSVLAASGDCIEVPHDVGLADVPVVKVNGVAMAVEGRGTMRDVLGLAGVTQPGSILASLHVERLYLGRLTPVEFNRADASILDLPLLGGEVLHWLQPTGR